jgi:hypothetical protein
MKEFREQSQQIESQLLLIEDTAKVSGMMWPISGKTIQNTNSTP